MPRDHLVTVNSDPFCNFSSQSDFPKPPVKTFRMHVLVILAQPNTTTLSECNVSQLGVVLLTEGISSGSIQNGLLALVIVRFLHPSQ